jgi:hypothetical protein
VATKRKLLTATTLAAWMLRASTLKHSQIEKSNDEEQ